LHKYVGTPADSMRRPDFHLLKIHNAELLVTLAGYKSQAVSRIDGHPHAA